MAPLTQRINYMRIDRPDKEGIKTGYDWFVNPVGSLIDGMVNDYGETRQNDDGSTDIIGSLGSVRHTGTFSPNNPYLKQLQSASKNQDKDALYELATKWEADYANTQEAREYDSPAARIARDRAAGINSDIAGGSSSAGTPAGSAPVIPQQQGTTKFSNMYDNISTTLDVVNTVVDTATSFTGLVGTLGTLTDTISMSHNAAARDRIMTERMPDILSKEGISQYATERRQAQDISDKYGAWSEVVSNFSFADDSQPTTEELNNLYQSLGLFEDGQRTEFKNWLSSPNAIKEIKTAQLEKNQAKAQETAWTYDAILRKNQLDVAFQINKLEADSVFEGIRSLFAVKVNEHSDELTSSASTGLLSETNADMKSAQLSEAVAQQELKRFELFTQNQSKLLRDLDSFMKDLEKTGLNTNELRYLYNLNALARQQVMSMGFNQYYEMFNLYRQSMTSTQAGYEYLGDDGKVNLTDPVLNSAIKDFFSLSSGHGGSISNLNPFEMALDLARIFVTRRFRYTRISK